MTPEHKHAQRVHAMRIANTLARFQIPEYCQRWIGNRNTQQRTECPDFKKWSFIDVDPLLGNVDEFLIDDGARATWPLDFAVAASFDDTSLNWRATYCRTISGAEARRLGVRVFSQKMLAVEQITMFDGRWSFGSGPVSLIGKKWVEADRTNRDVIRDGQPVSPRFGDMMAGIALRHRYEWSAIFSFPTGLNLRFGTTAQGALAIFKDRSRENDQLRRAPILHWVRQHWRRGQATGDTVREVRKHMRGKEHLIWHGIPVTLIPAEYEMEQIA